MGGKLSLLMLCSCSAFSESWRRLPINQILSLLQLTFKRHAVSLLDVTLPALPYPPTSGRRVAINRICRCKRKRNFRAKPRWNHIWNFSWKGPRAVATQCHDQLSITTNSANEYITLSSRLTAYPYRDWPPKQSSQILTGSLGIHQLTTPKRPKRKKQLVRKQQTQPWPWSINRLVEHYLKS